MNAIEEIERIAENKVYEGIFRIFELELEEIGRFIAFTSGNMNAYSNKIHELHLRVCSEVENALKIVIHKHFVSAGEVKNRWDAEKSAFLEKKSLTPKYEELKNELNRNGKEKLDRLLFGFPDFSFYFKIARERFNLHRKVIKHTGMISHSIDWEMIQPFELEEGRDVPAWWTNYNNLKHDKIKNYNACTLGDLIYSMSGLFILMNYLLKYLENNTPIPDRDFELDGLKGLKVSDCSFCSFESKYFAASSASQSRIYSMFLPSHIAEDDFENLTILDLELRYTNNKFKNIVEYENQKIKDFDFALLEHDECKLTGHAINNKNDLFRSIENALFYTYLDYTQTINWNNQYFRELRHFGKFIN